MRFRKTQEAPAKDGLESSVTELEKGFMKLIERAVRALRKVGSTFRPLKVGSTFRPLKVGGRHLDPDCRVYN